MSSSEGITYCQIKEISTSTTNVLLIIYFIFCGLLAVSTAVIMTKYMCHLSKSAINYKKRVGNMSKSDSLSNQIYHCILFISTIITISLFPIQFYFICHPTKSELLVNGTDVIWSLSLLIHQTGLVKCFYNRLYLLFHATTFELSKFTQKSFSISLVMVLIYGMVGLVGYALGFLDGYIAGFVFLSGFFMYFLYLFCLTLILIHKLTKAYRDHKDQVFIDHVIKATILVFISLSITSLRAIIGVLYFYSTNLLYIEWISYYVALIDTYTNCICVILFWKKYDRIYKRFCQCIEFGCKSCCFGKYIMQNDVKNLSQVVEQSRTRTNTKITFSVSEKMDSVAVDVITGTNTAKQSGQ